MPRIIRTTIICPIYHSWCRVVYNASATEQGTTWMNLGWVGGEAEAEHDTQHMQEWRTELEEMPEDAFGGRQQLIVETRETLCDSGDSVVCGL